MKTSIAGPLLGAAAYFAFAVAAPATASAAIVTNVNIVDNAFTPTAVAIQVNDKVKWTWVGTNPHSSTSDTGIWDSAVHGTGSTFTNTFPASGNFPYHCNVHAFMTASITVMSNLNGAPVIVTPPANLTVGPGQDATFSVTATGLAPLAYQWRFQGANLANATATAFTVLGAQFANAGPYTVVVSNSVGSVTSSPAILRVAPLALMTVHTNGNGTVHPNYDEQSLVVGDTYTMTAVPGPGFAFTSWTGGIATNSPTIIFIMQSNLVLQANFGPGTFTAGKAVYEGLFYESNGVKLASSGAFTLTTTAKGAFSGSLRTAAARYPLKGVFEPNGTATVSVNRRSAGPLEVFLQLDLTPGSDQIVGHVSAGAFSSLLIGARRLFDARTNQSPQAGKYTMLIPNASEGAGDGFGSVSVDTAGRIKMKGILADGTRMAQASIVSRDGAWPLFAPLRGGSGTVVSWVSFIDTPTNDLTGPLTWIQAAAPVKPMNPYAAGTIIETIVQGSVYQPPLKGGQVLNLTSANLLLIGGGLTSPITNAVTISPGNRITSDSGAKLSLKFNSSLGTMTGSIQPSADERPLRFTGVALQKLNLARGYFFGTVTNGSVQLQAR